jgi:hypothetical protein
LSGDDGSKEHARLGWRDYLALFVAIVQTVALPIVILIVILIAILLVSAAVR